MTDTGSGARPIYSIGAVAAMLGVETATLRAWEERYGVVVPVRSGGAQRIYSRDELEQLRFVVDAIAHGSTPADAHRLLADRLSGGATTLSHPDPQGATIVVLLAERDRYAAELFEYFLRTEGFVVCSAFDPLVAEDLFDERQPDLSVVELMLPGGGLALCRRLAARGRPVLAVSALDLADEALTAGASGYLPKPVVPLQFVSAVRDLLGRSALTRRPAGA
jgi:DNA-binding transcriptional MerR regulator